MAWHATDVVRGVQVRVSEHALRARAQRCTCGSTGVR